MLGILLAVGEASVPVQPSLCGAVTRGEPRGGGAATRG